MFYVIPSKSSVLVTSAQPAAGVKVLFSGDRAGANAFAATFFKDRKPAPAPAPKQETIPFDETNIEDHLALALEQEGAKLAEAERQLKSIQGQWQCHMARATAIHAVLMTARKGSAEWKQAMQSLALMDTRNR